MTIQKNTNVTMSFGFHFTGHYSYGVELAYEDVDLINDRLWFINHSADVLP